MCEEKLLIYNTDVQTYQAAVNAPIDPYTNSLTVKNTGTTLCIFQSDTLQPGESKSYGGNRGEVFRGRLDLRFQTQAVPPAIITNEATVTLKVYLNVGENVLI